jgi:DNA-binding NtrC family response regulator
VRSILIVDEDMSMREDLAASVQKVGSTAQTAATFREGVRLLESVPTDVLITRLQLGAYNGLHLLVRGRSEYPHLYGIVVGPADPVAEREAYELGAAAYLVAPSTSAILTEIQKLTAAA